MKQDKERIKELKQMASGLYGSIAGLTNSPYEACIIIEMLHLMLWIQNREPGFDVKLMLKNYCTSFEQNLEVNDAFEKGQMQ